MVALQGKGDLSEGAGKRRIEAYRQFGGQRLRLADNGDER